MNRGLKALGIVLSLLLLSVLVTMMVFTSSVVPLPFELRPSLSLFRPLTNYYFQQYLFWIALFFAVLLVILIFVLLFYPRVKQTFVLEENKGRLSLDKKAIEGFVRSKIKGVGFVDSPKVKVRGTTRKINVYINGQLTRTSSIIGKTEALMEDIRTDLQQILGPEEKVKINVTYKEYEKEEKANRAARVE